MDGNVDLGEGFAFTKIQNNRLGSLMNVYYESITNAKYVVTDSAGRTGTTNIGVYMPTQTWSQTDASLFAKYSPNRNYAYNTFNRSQTIEIPLGDVIKDWFRNAANDGGYSKDCGFFLQSSQEVHFYSVNSSTSYKPYLRFSYNECTELSTGTYFIRSTRDNKYMDVAGNVAPYNSQNIIMYNFNGGVNQRWNIVKHNDGEYSILLNSNTNFSMDVNGWYDQNGADISVWQSNGQRFKIIKNQAGNYRIMPAYSSSRGLDVYLGSDPTMYNRDIILYDYSGGSNQKWAFVSSISTGAPCLGQEMNLWCWAASAQMVSRTHIAPMRTQTEIVTQIKGSAVNEAGSPIETRNAVNWASNSTAYVFINNPLSESELIKKIESGISVIITRGFYDENNERTNGHATVIYGFRLDGANVSFMINDPWPAVSNPWPTNNTGQRYERLYVQILDGNFGSVDNGRWERSIYR